MNDMVNLVDRLRNMWYAGYVMGKCGSFEDIVVGICIVMKMNKKLWAEGSRFSLIPN